ncbi:MAG TPA: M1 family metallopeptidase [Nocardioidaceae bacterium]|nr:M1 family metallopeptidase [Nocardioidaceae bacterium]
MAPSSRRRGRPRRRLVAVAAAGVLAVATACSGSSDLTSSDESGGEQGPTTGPTAGPNGGQPPAKIDLSEAESQPVDDPYYPQNGEPYLDTLHYDLDLDWNPATKLLQGTDEIRFRVTEPRNQIQLDFGAPLSITGATLDGKQTKTAERGEQLVVTTPGLKPGGDHTLVLRYRGTPHPVKAAGSRTDLLNVGWTTESDGSVWTMQEPWGAYTWYPVNDHPSDKAFYDATISTSGGMIGIFNGDEVSHKTEGDTTTTVWHVQAPAASYLTTIAIGDYQETTDEGPNGLPISYWVQPQDDNALDWLKESPQMLSWLEATLGDYPFDRIGAVVVPSNSAMETQTLVTMGSGVFHADEVDLRGALLHEYAHQWYGDVVTPDNWTDLWLNESFAMYIQLLWSDSVGLLDYDSTIANWESLDGQLRSQFGPPGEYFPDEFASSNVYLSGAVMLDRIRQQIGDDAFFDALRTWPTVHEYGNANRDDYISWLSDRTGTDLGPLINEWLTSPTTPS